MNERHANALFEQSILLLQQGQAQEALEMLAKLDKAIPSNPGILFFSATGFSIAGNKRKAIQTYERVIRLNPQFIEAYNNLALDLAYLGEHENALRNLEIALKIRPDFVEAINNKGNCLMALGRFDEALQCFETALRLHAKNTVALANLAEIFINRGQLDRAASYAERAIKINPKDHRAHLSLGAISTNNGDFEGALQNFLKAHECSPNDPDILAALGGAYVRLGKNDVANNFFQRALKINPQNGRTHLILGLMHQDLGEYDESIFHLSAPVQDKHRLIQREYNRALSYLHKGDLNSGWSDYAWRWKVSGVVSSYLSTEKPAWNGASTEERIFIWGEQGIGDQLLFCSLLEEASNVAPNLHVRLDRRLIPLFKRSFPTLSFTSLESEVSDMDFDAHLPMGDLPRIFRHSFYDFSKGRFSYLQSNPHLTEKLLSGPLKPFRHDKLCIGVSWKTLGKNSTDRNLPIEQLFATITKKIACELIDLQYSDTLENRIKLRESCNIEIHHLADVDNFNNLDGLGSLIMACDAIITCSNSTAHLAGALGKETYLLVPFARGRHWYWSHIDEHGRSLWYPSIRVIPQIIQGDWSTPIEELQHCLSNRPKLH